jgi:hypothetical protein
MKSRKDEEPDEESVRACFLGLALYLWKYRAVFELLLAIKNQNSKTELRNIIEYVEITVCTNS